MQIDKMPLKELIALKHKVDAALPIARARELSDVRAEIAKMAAVKGYTVAEILGGKPGKTAKATKLAKSAKPSDDGVKYIFRDKVSGAEYPGKGRPRADFQMARAERVPA